MALRRDSAGLNQRLDRCFAPATRRFVDYWFARETQRELQALLEPIEVISDAALQAFLQLVFSSIIITKSGGVTLAYDLAHTRPHRAKVAKNRAGRVILGHERTQDPSPCIQRLTKTPKSPLEAFARRLAQNVRGLAALSVTRPAVRAEIGDTQDLPLAAHGERGQDVFRCVEGSCPSRIQAVSIVAVDTVTSKPVPQAVPPRSGHAGTPR